MEKLVLFYFLTVSCYFIGTSQPINLPETNVYKDTTTYYYITFDEAFDELFYSYNYSSPQKDSTLVDFSKFDLKGTKKNNVWFWELISPKKYNTLGFQFLPWLDTVSWEISPQPIIIQDSLAFDALKKNSKYGISKKIDFKNHLLIYNEIWVDCHGQLSYNVEYDRIENKTVVYIITKYGGCAGMKTIDSWILIEKPNAHVKIELDEIRLH